MLKFHGGKSKWQKGLVLQSIFLRGGYTARRNSQPPLVGPRKVGVFPHLEGLARITEGDADPLTILSSWDKKWQENQSLRQARTIKEEKIDEKEPYSKLRDSLKTRKVPRTRKRIKVPHPKKKIPS